MSLALADMETLKASLEAALPGCVVEMVMNPSACAQHSLLVTPADAVAVATLLRDAEGFDYCSNVTGVDWPAREVTEKVKVKKLVEGVEQEVEETQKRMTDAYLEVVYHLYSMKNPKGPLVLRMRTGDRVEKVHVPSLTPVWRSAEFQEREVFDLYGVIFDGHPDLRRLLMWEEFTDFPMRRDYVEPDDYEYEPTAHDDVLKKMQEHYSGQVRTGAVQE
ncbi:NADH-quinone oxidoreductase subunit C [Granulicella sp. 5B5]|uniref:NADH-quinone oxidoreductase subunit C n=1 Tax=Granulicella sp. 5B5 TaxID=1617967 RepID=UPI0015F45807|nr:NADH-quinone oxidoreductase subunit C [Granulicella sp. 5B5]QMV17297.1 NADH-quinone oxidoreductase subunit C [Granulicella sp. 5B5]